MAGMRQQRRNVSTAMCNSTKGIAYDSHKSDYYTFGAHPVGRTRNSHLLDHLPHITTQNAILCVQTVIGLKITCRRKRCTNRYGSSIPCHFIPRSIRHLQTSTPAGSVSSTTTPSPPVLRSPSPHSAKLAAKDAAAAEKKEKKRKELSSGRQKKFHRHFQQVAADEHVINCT